MDQTSWMELGFQVKSVLSSVQKESTVVNLSANTAGWFRQRNLGNEPGRGHGEHPSEVVVYLLVTLAVHPERLPSRVTEFLATRYLAHCVGRDRH